MLNDELRALVNALDRIALTHVMIAPDESALESATAYLRACADAKPVGYVTANGLHSLRQDDATVLLYAHDYLIRPDHVALYTHPAPAVPAGYKLVPVEPTPEMLASTSWPGCAGTDYAHMLAAAPASPQAEPKEE